MYIRKVIIFVISIFSILSFNPNFSEAAVSPVMTVTNPVINKSFSLSANGSGLLDAKLVYDLDIPGAVITRIEGTAVKSGGHILNNGFLILGRFIEGSPGNYIVPSQADGRINLGGAYSFPSDFAVDINFTSYPKVAGSQKIYVFGDSYAYGTNYPYNIIISITKIEYRIWDLDTFIVNFNQNQRRAEGTMYRAENNPIMDIVWKSSAGFSGLCSNSGNKNYSFVDYNPSNFGGWIVYSAELYPGGYMIPDSRNPRPLVKTYILDIPFNQDVDSKLNNFESTLNTILNELNSVKGKVSITDSKIDLTNNRLDSIDSNIENLMTTINTRRNTPLILGINGLNGSTCTITDSFNMVIKSSAVEELRVKVGNSEWSPWFINSDVVNIGGLNSTGVYTIHVEGKNSNGDIARGKLTIFKL